MLLSSDIPNVGGQSIGHPYLLHPLWIHFPALNVNTASDSALSHANGSLNFMAESAHQAGEVLPRPPLSSFFHLELLWLPLLCCFRCRKHTTKDFFTLSLQATRSCSCIATSRNGEWVDLCIASYWCTSVHDSHQSKSNLHGEWRMEHREQQKPKAT